MGNTFRKKHPLEHLTKPTGLYPEGTPNWKGAVIAKCIYSGKMAPRFPGVEDESGTVKCECPICFLYYPDHAMNATSCCKQEVCTECVLQVLKPSEPATCPFCNKNGLKFVVKVAAVEQPERFGLSAEQYGRYVQDVRRLKEKGKAAANSESSQANLVTATKKERAEHEEYCAQLNRAAELERQTSPTLKAFNRSVQGRQVPSYSLDSSGAFNRNYRAPPAQGRRSGGGSPRRRGSRRGRVLRGNSASAAATNRQQQLSSTTFDIPGDLAQMLTQGNIEELMMAEAIRRSMAESATSSSEATPGGTVSGTDANTEEDQAVSEENSRKEETPLEKAIRLSLLEANEPEALQSTELSVEDRPAKREDGDHADNEDKKAAADTSIGRKSEVQESVGNIHAKNLEDAKFLSRVEATLEDDCKKGSADSKRSAREVDASTEVKIPTVPPQALAQPPSETFANREEHTGNGATVETSETIAIEEALKQDTSAKLTVQTSTPGDTGAVVGGGSGDEVIAGRKSDEGGEVSESAESTDLDARKPSDAEDSTSGPVKEPDSTPRPEVQATNSAGSKTEELEGSSLEVPGKTLPAREDAEGDTPVVKNDGAVTELE